MLNETEFLITADNCDKFLDIDTKRIRCFLCDKDFVTGDKSFLIFNERLSSDGTEVECPLAYILSLALNMDVEETSTHSSLLCYQCNAILLDYERIDQELCQLRLGILKAYNNTMLRLEEKNMLIEEEGNNLSEIKNNNNDAEYCEDDLVSEDFNFVENDFDIADIIEEVPNDNVTSKHSKLQAFFDYEETDELHNPDFQNNNHEEDDKEDNNVKSILVEKQNELFACCMCDKKTFYSRKEFSEHMHSVHNLRIYPCDFCNKTFQWELDLNRHIVKEHENYIELNDGTQFQCGICDCCFDHYNLLKIHMQKQHSTKSHDKRKRPYICDECGKTFATLQNLSCHKSTHSKEKLFVCNICSKSFATQNNLDKHSIVHTGERPYTCGICDKSFARRSDITLHERIHTGERPFQCDLCAMTFTQRSNLWTHKKTTHFHEMLHKCEICERAFKRRRLLEYHINSVHTGERPYKCELCNSTFVYPEHYKKHLNVHSDNRPFACEICGKCFKSRDNRNAHRFVHSDKKLYECLKCGAGFMRKPQLLAHMNHFAHNNDVIIVNQPQINESCIESK